MTSFKICTMDKTTDEREPRLAMAAFLQTFSHDGIFGPPPQQD